MFIFTFFRDFHYFSLFLQRFVIDFFQCFVGWPWLKTGNCILRSRLCFIITEGTVDEGEINGKTPTYGSPFKKMMFLFKTAHYSFLDGSMQKDVENHFPGETLVFPTALQGSKTPSASPRARRDRRRTAHGIPSGWAFGGGDGRPMAGAIRNH